jgi:beta-mannanase
MLKRIGLVGLCGIVMCACSDADDGTERQATRSNDQALSTSGAQDSYVTTSFPGQVRGTRTELKVGHAAATQEAYLRFDVSGLPADATAIKATLELRALNSTSAVVEAHAANSNAWDESTLVMANAPGAKAAVLSQIASTTAATASKFDVSAAVTGNGTFSFVLKTATAQTATFASKEAGAATAPKLTVEYSAPAMSTAFGSAFNPHDNARYDDLIRQWGAVKVARSFDGGNGVNPFLNTYQAQDVTRNAISAYSFKYPPTDITAGKYDADLEKFFRGIKDDHPVYWTYWHEPDDEIYKSHTFTPTQYRAAWAYIRRIADSVKSTRPRLAIFATSIIMEYSMRPNIAPQRPLLGPDGMYPGDDVIDVFGVDSYNSAADQGDVRDADEEFGKVIDFAKAHGKPWAIGEIGSCVVTGKPDGRATFLSNSIKYWKSRAYVPVYVSYFNVDWPTCDYRLDTDAAATRVWRDAITLGYSAF